jgi:DNA polymerase III subunit gamma/tau
MGKMTSQVFYRKWRPRTFAEVAGQEQVTQTLSNALSTGRVSHAYLFYGPRGTGKTSTGRILAKAVNCLNRNGGEPCNACDMCRAITEGRAMDVIEIDAASNRGIDEIRDLREKVNYAPGQARHKVYIIDEVHMLTKEAANALLKTLEEPPPYVIFILATTEVHRVPATILSRCQRFDFRRITQADVAARLAQVCQAEGITIEPEGLRLIARSATGSLRDALNLLEQITAYCGNSIDLRQVQGILGITGDQRARQLLKNIVDNDTAAGVLTIHSVSSDGLDLRQFNREVVEYLRALLLVKAGSAEAVDLTAEDIADLKALAARTSLALVSRTIKLFSQIEFGFDEYSTLPLELAVVDCTQPLPIAKADTVPAARPADEAAAIKNPAARPIAVKATPRPAAARPSTAQATPVRPVAAAAPPSTASKPPVEAAAGHTAPVPVKTETPVVEAAAAPELHSEIDRLRLHWKQVFEQAPEEVRKTAAAAILKNSGVKPQKIENDTVVLVFRYPIHMQKMETPENQQIAEKILSAFLGRPIRVQYVHEPEDNHLLNAALKMGAQVTSVEEK